MTGERAVREAHEDALITRISLVYGVHRVRGELTGLPAWARDKLVADESVPLFIDQRVTPTRAGHAAEVLLDPVDRSVAGAVNIASHSCVSPFKFGEAISEHLSKSYNTLVEAKQDSVERAARRYNTPVSIRPESKSSSDAPNRHFLTTSTRLRRI